MLFKKTLVLSSVDGGNEKAVLSFENEEGATVGQAKLYNFSSEPDGILSLGLKEGDKVQKAGLSKIGYMKYKFAFNTPLKLDEFSCALINIFKGEVSPLLHGCTQNTKLADQFLAQAVMDMDKAITMSEVEEVLDKNNIHLENEEEAEKMIEQCTSECSADKCSACKYRYAFFSNDAQSEEAESTFFDSIEEDINKLFSSHSEEELLAQIIPFSKWVKIESENSEEYYVLGLIYENDKVKYICYGVPSMYSANPPKELEGYCEWLPLDSTKPYDFGYFITYQDAVSGENVKASFTVV